VESGRGGVGSDCLAIGLYSAALSYCKCSEALRTMKNQKIRSGEI
jgi:hypothetical protein